MDYSNYDRIIIAFSGGKDSLACLLDVLESGVDTNKVELWHHLIDGREGSALMDWAITDDYCATVAKAFNIPIYFSWKDGGFEREMLRDNSPTGDILYESTKGETVRLLGSLKHLGTRHKFPQVSADLSVRWCSAYLKIDVAKRVLNNDLRFQSGKTLFITGERAEESDKNWKTKTPEERKGRASYAQFEPHSSDLRNGKRVQRYIDHYRPVLYWEEQKVWDLIEAYKINPHPAYRMGWGRVSCAGCIFGQKNMWSSLMEVNPKQFETIAEYEEQFQITIHRKESVRTLAANGLNYAGITPDLMKLATGKQFTEDLFTEDWKMPLGAFGESCGAI